MLTQTPAVAHFAGSTPAFSAEQESLLRAADGLRGRLKRAPRLTELLQLFHSLGYRRLPPDLLARYDAGELQSVPQDSAAASAPRGEAEPDARSEGDAGPGRDANLKSTASPDA